MPTNLNSAVVWMLVFGFVWLALIVYQHWNVRRAAKEMAGADDLRTSQGPCLVPADPAEFSWLDRDFYDTTADAFARLGFRFIADLENTTETAATPYMRRFTREMCSEDETVSVGIVMIGVHRRRMPLRMRWIPVEPKYLISLQSVTGDRIRLLTHNGRGMAAELEVPGFVIESLTPDTSVDELNRHHQALLQKTIDEVPELVFDTCSDVEDIQHWANDEHAWLCKCKVYQQITESSLSFTCESDPKLQEAADRLAGAYVREKLQREKIDDAAE